MDVRTASRGAMLIVEDEPEIQGDLLQLLEDAAYIAVAAGTGTEALELVGDEEPRLAIVDIKLPGGISGYEVIRQLRERFGDRVPILALSGVRTESFDAVAGLEIGADDYMTKAVRSRRAPRAGPKPAATVGARERQRWRLKPHEPGTRGAAGSRRCASGGRHSGAAGDQPAHRHNAH